MGIYALCFKHVFMFILANISVYSIHTYRHVQCAAFALYVYKYKIPQYVCMCLCLATVQITLNATTSEWIMHANTQTHKYTLNSNNVEHSHPYPHIYYLFVFWLHQYYVYLYYNGTHHQRCIVFAHLIPSLLLQNCFQCVEIAQFLACECVARVD